MSMATFQDNLAMPSAARTGPSTSLLLVFAALILIALAAVPYLVAPYQTVLLTYGLIYAIAALGFNLLLGYTGLLSFGHSAYFGAGAYTVAFIVRDLGVHSMELCILGGLLGTLLVAGLFGYVCVRHTRIFFGILTLALSQVLWSLAFKFFWVTGGTDGIRVASANLTLLAGLIDFRGPGAYQRFVFAYYYYVLALFAISTVILWVIVHSPFGKALQAIRDNETRARFVGISVRHYRWVAFMISGVFTGLAGILWVPLNGLTTPDILYWPFSGEIVFMSVLGGFRTFTGPIVGAIAFNYLKTYAIASTEYWQLLLGQVLVVLVMMLPTGIVGALSNPKATYHAVIATSADVLIRNGGILLILIAFNWWLVFYSKVGELIHVVDCMVYTTTPCEKIIATAQLTGRVVYQPLLMWIGLMCLGAALILYISRNARLRPMAVSGGHLPLNGRSR
jgi:branched-chain amino acid transport system permease protein